MNAKLDAIAKDAAAKLVSLWSEAELDIERGIEVAVTEAQENDKEARFTIGFAIVLNLDKNVVNHRLSFSTRHKLESITTMPDVNQENLPFITAEEDTK